MLDVAQRVSLYLAGSIIFISSLCSMLLRECLYIYLAPLFLFHPCVRCCLESVFISIWFHYFYFIPVLDVAQRVSLYLSGSIIFISSLCSMLLKECLYIYLVPLFLFHPLLDIALRVSLFLSGSIIFISSLCSVLLRECLYIYLAPLFLFHPCARCCSESVFISIWLHYFYFIPVLDAAQRVSLYLYGSIIFIS